MANKLNYGCGKSGFMRIGDYVVRHTDGIVDYLYRMDNPKKVYRTRGVLTVKAAQIRSARKKLENVIV